MLRLAKGIQPIQGPIIGGEVKLLVKVLESSSDPHSSLITFSTLVTTDFDYFYIRS